MGFCLFWVLFFANNALEVKKTPVHAGFKNYDKPVISSLPFQYLGFLPRFDQLSLRFPANLSPWWWRAGLAKGAATQTAWVR
ncbi:hypothetical protein ACM5Q9_09650 [Advenella sp. RU8]|uniref:hypothetical protein n=1 Tax=Advenella sp. RU8 TaxID=3399575 RepID=UPI003AAC0B90